jgi:hypothetical protein
LRIAKADPSPLSSRAHLTNSRASSIDLYGKLTAPDAGTSVKTIDLVERAALSFAKEVATVASKAIPASATPSGSNWQIKPGDISDAQIAAITLLRLVEQNREARISETLRNAKTVLEMAKTVLSWYAGGNQAFLTSGQFQAAIFGDHGVNPMKLADDYLVRWDYPHVSVNQVQPKMRSRACSPRSASSMTSTWMGRSTLPAATP